MPRSSRGSSSSSKKIIVYAMIGIVAVAAVSVSFLGRPPSGTNNEDDALQRFQEQWCGPNAVPNSNEYVTEFVLQSECEMPAGIAADGDNVWYVSAKEGFLGGYNSAEGEFSNYKIPDWPSLDRPYTSIGSWQMSWSVRVDGAGDVWFTDQNNAIWRFDRSTESFDKFNVPARYPSDMEFDADGNIYFVGINSHSIFFGDVSEMRDGTSEGITEIKLPLDGFDGIDLDIVTSGLLVLDNERKNAWVSLLAFQRKGQLFQYDLESGQVVRTIDLPADMSSPVGAALDNSGNLWVADHGSNIFFMFNPASGEITKFVTSVASPMIYGGTTPQNAFTWPYWMASGPDGSIWFNEHIGNKIARFDPEERTLTEYWVPSQNSVWARCPEDAATCGIANAIQLTVSEENQVWFTEWTENKIAQLDATKQVPISVSVPEEEITVGRGDSTEIRLTLDSLGDFEGTMLASGTMLPNGMLGESSGIFSQESVSVSGSSKQVSYTFTPDQELSAGQYTLMLGAGNDEVSVMKAVRVNIV